MKKIKDARLVVFDLDGTIIESEPVHMKAWNLVLKKYGIQYEPSHYQKFVGLGDDLFAKNHVEQLNLDIDAKELADMKRDTYRKIINSVSFREGVFDLIKELHKSKRLAVASSEVSPTVIQILDEKGIRDLFEIVVGSDNVSNMKPDPEIYSYTCKQLGIEPKDAVAIEDSALGVESAKAAGMFTIAVPNKYTKGHDLSKADILFDNFNELRVKLCAAFLE